jgi:hypothetical protein
MRPVRPVRRGGILLCHSSLALIAHGPVGRASASASASAGRLCSPRTHRIPRERGGLAIPRGVQVTLSLPHGITRNGFYLSIQRNQSVQIATGRRTCFDFENECGAHVRLGRQSSCVLLSAARIAAYTLENSIQSQVQSKPPESKRGGEASLLLSVHHPLGPTEDPGGQSRPRERHERAPTRVVRNLTWLDTSADQPECVGRTRGPRPWPG